MDGFAPGHFAPWTIRPGTICSIHVDVSSLEFLPLNFRSWAFYPLDVDVQMEGKEGEVHFPHSKFLDPPMLDIALRISGGHCSVL